jgi:monoamine oxidase
MDDEAKEKKREYCKRYYREKRDLINDSSRKKWRLRTEEERKEDYLRQREYYENNKEAIQSRARERYKNLTPEQKQQNTARTKEWRRRNGEKTKAWSAVGNALFKGEIEKPPYCELCGVFDVKIHAHHEDYSKPLDVLWLCHDCHMSLHADERIDEHRKTQKYQNVR